MALPDSIAERHRAVAVRFATVVAGVPDWEAPTPVKEWQAKDVLDHLLTWIPGFLAMGSEVRLPEAPTGDPAAAWRARSQDVQALLDDPEVAGSHFEHSQIGSGTLAQIIDRYYTADIFLHTWDLARASGQDATLDPDQCHDMFTGMSAMSEVIRASGQFGDQQPVPLDAGPQDTLIAFIGRDPAWTP